VAATGLADVLVGDADPVVLLGLHHQPLQQLAVALLDIGVISEESAHIREPSEQTVAHLLELPDSEYSGAPGGSDVVGDPTAWKGGDEELCEFQVKVRDLPAQFGAARALVGMQDLGEASWGRRRSG